MSFKVVRDASNNVVGFGPNVEECVPALRAGDTLAIEETAPVIVPRITKVTMRQARLALLGAGLLPTVSGAIAEMTGPAGEAARIEWEYSQEVQRDRGLVLALGTQMGMTEAQLDALFATAAATP